MQQFNYLFESGFLPGRYHIVHFGHEYLLGKSLGLVNRLTVGIGGKNDVLTLQDPYTYNQREDMLLTIIKKRNWEERILIVPLYDFGNDQIWLEHCIEQTGGNIGLVSTNNTHVLGIFADAGYPVLYTGLKKREILEGVKLREWLAKGDERWKLFVDESIIQKAEYYYWKNIKEGLLPGKESQFGSNIEF